MTADHTTEREQPGSVYIVLATYDAAPYLVEQIESIRSQTFIAWKLLTRDDGSCDATERVLDEFAARDCRIEVVRDGAGHLGAVGNFSRLASLAFERGASTIFFADQDDVWSPDKVMRTMERMRAAEARLGADRPILVHTDLQLVDGEGRLLHRSFMEFQRIHDAGLDDVTTLLVQNYVTGCTMAANRSLLRFALPIPDEALVHDWWLALCAAARGSIEFVPVATIAYRRHGTNAVTVRGFWRTLNPFRTNWGELWRTGRRNHARAVEQAQALAERLAEKGAALDATAALVGAFVRLHDRARSTPSRIGGALQLKLRSQTLPRTLALYLRLLRWRT